MDQLDPRDLGRASDSLLAIMGKVAASFTHEVKNQLGIMQEQAGLLQDLAKMAQQKGGLDPQKVDNLAGRLGQKVRQSDEIVKGYNAFAHLADREFGSMQAGALLALLVRMHQRLAAKKPVELAMREPEQEMNLYTRPLFLAAAIFACLEAAVQAAPAGTRIEAWLEAGDDECIFGLTWQAGDTQPPGGPDPAILTVLQARMREPGEAGRLLMAVPRALAMGA